MNNEEYIVSQLLWFDSERALLPKMKKEWFTDDFNKKVIDVLTQLYYDNEPIDVVTLGRKFERSEIIRVIQLQQNVYGSPNVQRYLYELEANYLQKKFIDKIQAINTSSSLSDLILYTQLLIDESQTSSAKDPKSIIKVTNEVVDTIIEGIQRGDKITGRQTGWSSLDRILGGYNRGDLIVLAGRPGMGKTALALTLTKAFAEVGGKALLLSLEMSNEQLAKRYISLIGDIASWKIRNGSLKEHEITYLCDIANNQTTQFFIDDDADCTIQQIKSKAKIHKSRHGLELLVIDYLQLVKGTKQNREQEIAEISRTLKLLAKELQITVIVLAQLSRKCEERADKRPMLSDIRESGSVEQDADVIMFPFRPAYYEQGEKPPIEDSELIIAKNRHGESVTINTQFIGERTEYKQKI
jgi:replicative DNA helicase